MLQPISNAVPSLGCYIQKLIRTAHFICKGNLWFCNVSAAAAGTTRNTSPLPHFPSRPFTCFANFLLHGSEVSRIRQVTCFRERTRCRQFIHKFPSTLVKLPMRSLIPCSSCFLLHYKYTMWACGRIVVKALGYNRKVPASRPLEMNGSYQFTESFPQH